MSSVQLSPQTDYQFPDEPLTARLTRAEWNQAMLSISARLRTAENVSTALSELIDELKLFGLERLDEAIGPIIAEANSRIQQLADEVAAVKAENDQILDDFQEVTAVNLEALGQQIAAAAQSIDDIEAEFQAILAGGLPAGQVQESTTRVFVSPAQRTEIGAIRSEFDDLLDQFLELNDYDATSGTLRLPHITFAQIEAGRTGNALQDGRAYWITDRDQMAVGTGPNGYQIFERTSQKNVANGYAGLDASGKLLEAQVPQFLIEQTFLNSGTWTKDPRAKFVIIEVAAAGGGGGGAGSSAYGQSSVRAPNGGAGGEVNIFVIPASAVPASLQILVGAAGIGGTLNPLTAQNTSGTAGTAGGDSQAGPLFTARGGVGGVAGRIWSSTQSGQGTIVERGTSGGRGGRGSAWATSSESGVAGTGYSSGGGAGGESYGNPPTVAVGGSGAFGSGGNGTGAYSERHGKGFGGGGAGGNSGENGGNGAPGRVRISQI